MSDVYVPIKLPSKGLCYDGIDINTIKIRPFTGKEEELIVEFTPQNMKKKFVVLLENVLQGIKPQDLTSGDAKKIMLWEAITSYTNIYPVELICQSCYLPIAVKVDLNNIDVKELPDDYKQPVDVQISNTIVKLRLPTLQDEINQFDYEQGDRSSYLYGFALTMTGTDLDIIQRLKLLQNMSTKDLGKVRAFYETYDHGPTMLAPYKCPKCDGEGEVMLPFRFETLLSESAKS